MWLLAISSPEGVLAVPDSEEAIVTSVSPEDPPQASMPPLLPPGGQSPLGSPESLWGYSIAIDAAPQRSDGLLSRTIGKLTNRFWSPRPQEAPGTPAGPVAEGVTDRSSVATPSSSIQNVLIGHYQQQERFCQVPPFFPEGPATPIEKIHCHLMLLEQVTAKQAPQEVPEDQPMSRHEECKKLPIALLDLFKPRRIHPDEPVQEISKILLVGDAGAGKTTLSHKLVHDWAHGQWGQDFTAVYLLPVRNLQRNPYNGATSQTAPTLDTAIVRECFPASLWKDKEDFVRLRNQVQKELKHPTTLVILDGLDERQGTRKEIINEAVQGRHKLLMFSRPGIAHRWLFDLEIEHQGFDDVQMDDYVQKYFQKRGQADALSAELLKLIKQHPALKAIAHVPVTLEILCAWWCQDQRGLRTATMQGSLSGLYRELIGYMWDRCPRKQQVNKYREVFLASLGKNAWNFLQQGNAMIREEQAIIGGKKVEDMLVGPIGKAMLSETGFLRAVGQEQYKFPDLTFQEYFASRTLAAQLWSSKMNEQASVKEFVSKHKYESKYGRLFSFMAGEVSRAKGVTGIKELLSLLEAKKQKTVQHLILQLRVVHEWLSIATDREVKQGMRELEKEFRVMASLKDWFGKGLVEVRQKDYDPESPGGRLLGLLIDSLQIFRSILRQEPGILDPLQKAAKNKKERRDVRAAAFDCLVRVMSAVPTKSKEILATLREATQDADLQVRQAAVEALVPAISAVPKELGTILAILRNRVTKDQFDPVSQAAIRALVPAISASPNESDSILATLREAAKDSRCNVRHTAVEALVPAISAFSTNSGAILKILKTLRQAAKDLRYNVRQVAVESLGKVIVSVVKKFSKELLEAIRESLNTLQEAVKDEDDLVRKAAVGALGRIISTASKELPKEFSENILEALHQAVTKDEYSLVRLAAVKALVPATSAVSEELSGEILNMLCKATHDPWWKVGQAAVRALAPAISAVPHESAKILATLRKAAKDSRYFSIRQAAVEALVPAISAFPHESAKILKILYEAATHDRWWQVSQAAVEALVPAISAFPDESEAILAILRKAAEDPKWKVRSPAVKAIGKVTSVFPHKSEAILSTLIQSAHDKHELVRQEANKALAPAISAFPNESEVIRATLLRAAAHDLHYNVRRAAVEALGEIISAFPNESGLIRATLLKAAAHDLRYTVRRAAVEALGEIISAFPDESEEILATLRAVATNDSWPAVRQAAVNALVPAISAVPNESEEILATLHEVAIKDKYRDRYGNYAIREAANPFVCKLGSMLWEHYFGPVGGEPLLPSDIVKTLNSPCPFWRGRQVKDTHLLVLIPSYVAGKPLTLNYLGELIQAPKRGGHKTQYSHYWDSARNAIGNQSPDRSYWVLMTRDVIPGSKEKRYKDQRQLMANVPGFAYDLPGTLSAAVVMLLYHVLSGKRLYDGVYTRCGENVSNHQPAVGFSLEGPEVVTGADSYDILGAAGCIKF